ncbi:hypothetical protein [Actinokineospora enzanensis]|uniref:hypothetical protein n=1 Tax=Actinokineospora enzanensis TaxID=155975 RepID=UPI00036F364A|nr:hypothetical protein [Actinokineospora enzanensis]
MKTIAWIVLLIGLGLTAMYVATGLQGGEVAWLNGWLVGPIVLVFIAPTLFTLSAKLGGSLAQLRGVLPSGFQGAPIGMGTVLSVTRTGLTVNDQPQLAIALRVDTADGRTFDATTRQIIDLTQLGTVQSGAMLPVRYLPDNSVTLAVDATQAELQAVVNQIQLAKGHITAKQLHIAEHGLDAAAVVLAMVPTGEIRGDRAVVDLTLRVTRADNTMFDLTQQKAIPPALVPRVQPGSVVQVKYLPHDESEVTIITALQQER